MLNKKRIAESYDSSAEIYDNRYSDIQIQKYHEILSRLNFTDDDRIIDIGCGTGNLLGLLIAKLNGNVKHSFVGIDLSFEMIRIAHVKYPEIDFIVADSDNLPIRDESFDRVLSVTHLQNLPEPKMSLNEMYRIAVNDAQFAISILRKTWSLEKLKELISNSELTMHDEWIAEIEDIGVICHK